MLEYKRRVGEELLGIAKFYFKKIPKDLKCGL
jgi:hypothetical protein